MFYAITFCMHRECSFLSKAIVAEEAGAVAVIIMDSDIENDSALIQMQDDETQREVHIPAVFLLGKDGYVYNWFYIVSLWRNILPINLSSV